MRRRIVAIGLLAGAACGTPPRARFVEDIRYSARLEDDGKNALDLHVPAAPHFPTLVVLHGGGLVSGDKSENRFVIDRFAPDRFGVAIVGYRLSPGVTHPAHVRDAAAGVAWVKRHIGEYGGDPEQIFVVGYSAGAYLAAVLATDPRYLAEAGLSPRDLRGVVAVSGFFWVERVAPDRDKSIWGADPSVWADASPAHHLSPGVPPFLLVDADGDEPWRRQQNAEFLAALRANGRPETTLVEAKDRVHGTIWTGMEKPDDGVAAPIVTFVDGLRAHGTR